MIAQRHREPELMDQPQLDTQLHRHALVGLRRVNAFSGADRLLWGPIGHLARQQPRRALRILDLASGGGDLPVAIARRARRAGLRVHITGLELSTLAIEQARRLAAQAGLDTVEFQQLNVVHEHLPGGYDCVMCSLFLHHLADHEACELLRKMAASAGEMVLVNDLRRSRTGYLVAWAACRLLTRCRIVHVDGPRSVAAAFTAEELERLAERSGLAGAHVQRRWPHRLLLSWCRP